MKTAKTTSAKKYVNSDAQSIQTETKVSPSVNLTQEQVQEAIRLKAYEFYVQRGYRDGGDMEDWLIAEKEILQTV